MIDINKKHKEIEVELELLSELHSQALEQVEKIRGEQAEIKKKKDDLLQLHLKTAEQFNQINVQLENLRK
jgi:hypothetical protein